MATPQQKDLPMLGIIAAGGGIPSALCEAALAQRRNFHVVAFKDQADPGLSRYPHSWVRLGQLGALLAALHRAECREVVIVGSLRRPNLWKIGADFGLVRHLPTILSLKSGGDDAILTRIVRFFETQGMQVRGAHEIAPNLLAARGALGSFVPTAAEEADIACGLALLDALGPFDVGQAAVVANRHVLAVEAAEGTDEMLKRCGQLRQWGRKGRGGVLVKAPKPGQELRVDMPTIGSRTVELAAKAGLAGIAVASGSVMIADLTDMVAAADREKLFVFGADGSDRLALEAPPAYSGRVSGHNVETSS